MYRHYGRLRGHCIFFDFIRKIFILRQFFQNLFLSISPLFFLFILTTKGYSLLHWAACWGRLELIKYFVDANINIFLKNDNGETALDIAERYNKTECVPYLKKAGELTHGCYVTYCVIHSCVTTNFGRCYFYFLKYS